MGQYLMRMSTDKTAVFDMCTGSATAATWCVSYCGKMYLCVSVSDAEITDKALVFDMLGMRMGWCDCDIQQGPKAGIKPVTFYFVGYNRLYFVGQTQCVWGRTESNNVILSCCGREYITSQYLSLV